MLLLTLTPILLLLLSPTTATEEEISWKVTSLLQTDTSAPDDSYREREFSFNINTDEFICRNVLRIADTTSIPNWTNWTGGCVDKQGEDVDVEVFAFRFVSDWAEFIVDNAHDCVLALRQGVDDGEGDGDGDESLSQVDGIRQILLECGVPDGCDAKDCLTHYCNGTATEIFPSPSSSSSSSSSFL